MTQILITGATGQLGSELLKLQHLFPFECVFTTRDELNLLQPQTFSRFLSTNNFDYCINTAAYTQVDQAEKEQALAYQVNTTGVYELAKACMLNNIKLIHLSTDYVYHNALNRPLKEEDPTCPQSIYAKTKLEGEQLALAENPLTIIIRTSWVYSAFGKNFVKTMLRLGRERDALKVVYDQVGTPTYAGDLASAIFQIIQQTERSAHWRGYFGTVYNFSNEGVASWYDFSKAIFAIKGIDCKITPIESKDFPTAAVRPTFSLMNKEKIKRTFQLHIPYWRDSLKKCLKEL